MQPARGCDRALSLSQERLRSAWPKVNARPRDPRCHAPERYLRNRNPERERWLTTRTTPADTGSGSAGRVNPRNDMRPATHPGEPRLVTPDEGAPIDVPARHGTCTEAQYLQWTEHCRRLLEFTDGRLDILPMPTDRHQVIVRFLLLALLPQALELGGTALFAPLRLRIRDGKFREPDLLLVLDADDPRRGNQFWTGADLVVEVVSPDDPERDTRDKRLDYAEARIPEYWIVNPLDETVTVLVLVGSAYREHGVFVRGQPVASVCLPDCSLDVASLFDAH